MVSILLTALGLRCTPSALFQITGDTLINIKAKGKSKAVLLNLWVVTSLGSNDHFTGVA